MHRPDAGDLRRQRIDEALTQRRVDEGWRQRLVLESEQGAHPVIEGRRLLSFCSNDYLGLASDLRLAQAGRDAAERYGSGAGASQHLGGYSTLHQTLERRIAAWTGRQRALLFCNGYMANLALASSFLQPGDLALHDRLNHASLLDGARLSGVRFRRYAHADMDALRRLLSERAAGSAMVFSDAVFSMDGDLAPLPELAAVCREHRAWLAVDDAHGLGVLGSAGRGSLDAAGLSSADVPLLMGTLSKAFGSYGAFVAGDEDLIEYLAQFARTAIYTTALPPMVVGASLAALEIVECEAWRREKLGELVTRFRAGAKREGLTLGFSTTPIQPVLMGDSAHAMGVSNKLREAGILAPAIRPPTVPDGSARLRISLSAAHSGDDVDRLVLSLAKAIHQPTQSPTDGSFAHRKRAMGQ